MQTAYVVGRVVFLSLKRPGAASLAGDLRDPGGHLGRVTPGGTGGAGPPGGRAL
jgi:hypothetical protein